MGMVMGKGNEMACKDCGGEHPLKVRTLDREDAVATLHLAEADLDAWKDRLPQIAMMGMEISTLLHGVEDGLLELSELDDGKFFCGATDYGKLIIMGLPSLGMGPGRWN
jgi:hypothetical protein